MVSRRNLEAILLKERFQTNPVCMSPQVENPKKPTHNNDVSQAGSMRNVETITKLPT